jgi:UDP-glucose 4-epimerase
MENLQGLTVLIIGANGFLGRHLLARLRWQHCNIHAVSRSGAPDGTAVRWWQGNAKDIGWIRALTHRLKPDVIYQLASASVGGQDPALVLPTFEDDLQTSVNALIVAHECKVRRIILTRSMDEPVPLATKAPASPYAAAKAASGLYGQMFYELYGVPVVMLRPFMTYGPGQKGYKVVPYTILSMLKGESPKLSSGNRGVDWVYVDDVISAFIAAAIRPEAVGQEIDLGTGNLISVRAVIEEIQRLIPEAPEPTFGACPDRANEQVRAADIKTAEGSLGWRPSTSLRDGLSQTIEWYRRASISETLTAR